MIRHMVMWKMKDSIDKTKDIKILKTELKSLKEKISEIIELEVRRLTSGFRHA